MLNVTSERLLVSEDITALEAFVFHNDNYNSEYGTDTSKKEGGSVASLFYITSSRKIR